MRSQEIRQLEGRSPFVLDEPDGAWIVRVGRVDVFAVEIVDGEPVGRRHPICSAVAGDLLVGIRPTDVHALIGVGVSPTTVERVALADVAGEEGGPDLISHWAERLAAALVQPDEPDLVTLVAGEPAELPTGALARAARHTVWVDAAGLSVLGSPATGWVPLPPTAWVRAAGHVTVTPSTAGEALAHGLDGLASFGAAALARIGVDLTAAGAAADDRLQRLGEQDAELGARMYGELVAVVHAGGAQTTTTGEGALLAACRLVGRVGGFDVIEPTRSAALAAREPLAAIAGASGLRTREVALESDWWRRDAGPLLATLAADGRPVALLPGRPGRYALVDPQTGARERVDRRVAETLDPRAQSFYRPLPARPLSQRELVRFALRDGRRDLARLVTFGLGISLLSLVPPIVASVLFEDVVPSGDDRRLFGFTLLLVAVAIAATTFAIVNQISSLRLEARVTTPLQAAIWDRLLSLPAPFFRQYTSGDLSTRGLAVDAVRDTLRRATTVLVFGGFLILSNTVLLIVFAPALGLVALGVVLVAMIVIVLLGRSMLPHERRLQEARGLVYGTGFQIFSGIGKLRVAHAETRALAVWGHWFARMKEAFYSAQRRFVALNTFAATWPLLGTALVFLATATLPGASMTGAEFLAFNTAFQQVVYATVLFGGAVVSVVAAIPLWERTRPILDAVPEAVVSQLDPGRLQGVVELTTVSFRYTEEGPLVLDGVSFRAEPGEFVALVGHSGAGKSTLLRLLLGFEEPETGTVEYDGKSLGDLDVRAVRRQMGVVVQNARLLPGTILQNILGASIQLGVDDAWEAARVAGLEDDIRAMPMGMQTFISEGAATLSGGQRQRILIARAVAPRPRILIFDEATSALDNRTQAPVAASLERLRATRIVIAHRLSTIRGADRIVVVEHGRVVQTGTYDELAQREGPFAELVRRQLA